MTDLASGLRVLVDQPYLARPEYFDQQQRAVTDGAHPAIIEFARVFVRRMARKHGVPLFAHNMVRTAEQQTELFVRGVSLSKAGQSPHNYGCAVDIVHCIKAWDLELPSWTMLHHIGMEVAHGLGIKLVCGYDWDGDGDLTDQKLFDPAHWQLADWKSLKGGFPFSGG